MHMKDNFRSMKMKMSNKWPLGREYGPSEGRQIKQGKERMDMGTKKKMTGQRRIEKVIS